MSSGHLQFNYFTLKLIKKTTKQQNRNVTFYDHIWNQHGKSIKMNTNKPMFGQVVLEISSLITDSTDTH